MTHFNNYTLSTLVTLAMFSVAALLAAPLSAHAFPAVLGSKIIADQVFIDGLPVVSPTTVVVTSGQPVFSGYTIPNAQLTLIIRSETAEGKTLTNAKGYWSYTPPTPLSSGRHTLSLKTTDSKGVVGRPALAATFEVREGYRGAFTTFPTAGFRYNTQLDYLNITIAVLGSLTLLGTLYAFLLRRPVN